MGIVVRFLSRMRIGIKGWTSRQEDEPPPRLDHRVAQIVGSKGRSALARTSGDAGGLEWKPPSAATRLELDLNHARLVIDDGLLMVLGPDGDPVPPKAFTHIAGQQRDAVLPLSDDGSVPVAQVARVLEAQARGRLGPEGPGADGWIKAALGLGPAPAMTGDDELAAEVDAPFEEKEPPRVPGPGAAPAACEATLFGSEVVLGAPSGAAFVLAAATAETAPAVAARLLTEDGAPLPFADVVRRLRASFEEGAEPLAAGTLTQEGERLALVTPAGQRIRIEPLGDGDGVAGAVSIHQSDGEPATFAILRAALDERAPAAAAVPAGDDAFRPPVTDAATPDAAAAPAAGPALDAVAARNARERLATARELPETLVRKADGVVDLGGLANAAGQLGAAVDGVTIKGVPETAALSSGRQVGNGVWTLAIEDLRGLAMLTDPQTPLPPFLTVTFRAQDEEASVDLELADGTSPAGPANEHGPDVGAGEPPHPVTDEDSAPAGTAARGGAGARAAPDGGLEAGSGGAARTDDAPAPVARAAVAPPEVEQRAGEAREALVECRAEALPESPPASRTRLPLVVQPLPGAVVYVLSGVPPGTAPSAGVRNGDGTWTLTPDNLADLVLEVPEGGAPRPALEARAITVDDGAGTMTTVVQDVRLERGSEATPSSAPLELAGVVADAAGDATVDAVVIGGVPEGARLSAGFCDDGIRSWVLRADEIDGLSIHYADVPEQAVRLRVTVVSVDRATGGSCGRTRTVEAPRPVPAEAAGRPRPVGFWRPRGAPAGVSAGPTAHSPA